MENGKTFDDQIQSREPNMKITNTICLSVALVSLLWSAASADVSVFMKNGEIIEAQEAWGEADTIFIQVNPEVLLDFPAVEVDLKKTKIRKLKPAKATLELVDQVMEISGTRQQIEAFGSHFGGNAGNRSTESPDIMDGIFRESFNPSDAWNIIHQHLAQKLDQRTLSDVLGWYKKPIGVKIAQIDSENDPDRQQKIDAFLSNEATLIPKARLRLVAEIEKAIGLSEFEVRVTERSVRAMMEAIPADFPDKEKLRRQMAGSLKEQKNSLEKVRQKNVGRTVYSCRDLSTEELGEYLEFLRSASGSKYTKASIEGVGKMFDKFMDQVKKRFRMALMDLEKQRQ